MSNADKPGKKYQRALTSEEIRLWRLIMNQVKPIHHRPPEYDVKPDNPEPATPAASAPIQTVFTINNSVSQVNNATAEPLRSGHYAGIDRATATRLQRGKMKVEARLDMHGMNREQAQDALIACIERSYAAGKRCVLIITGKGGRGNTGKETGILKHLLPLWLNEPEIRKKVLAFDTATQQDGGQGAYYLLLKRKRLSDKHI